MGLFLSILCIAAVFFCGVYVMNTYSIYLLKGIKEGKSYRFFLDYDNIDRFNISIVICEVILFMFIIPFVL